MQTKDTLLALVANHGNSVVHLWLGKNQQPVGCFWEAGDEGRGFGMLCVQSSSVTLAQLCKRACVTNLTSKMSKAS